MYKDGKYIGYIYKIYNDINDKLYIGQTVRTIRHRFLQHIHSSKTASNSTMIIPKAINKYGADNFHIEEVEKIECDTSEELYNILNQKEQYYISLYNSIRPNGYNIRSGGDNADNLKIAVDQYDLHGNLLNTYNSIKEASEIISNTDIFISNVIISYVCSGKYKTAREYVFRYHGDPFDKYDVNVIRNNKKCVDQFDYFGNLLNSFESAASAVRYLKLLGYSIDRGSHITSCCKGDRLYAYNFIWRYHGDSFNKYLSEKDLNFLQISYKNKNLKIDQYDINGVLIKTYSNHKEIMKMLNYSGDYNTLYNDIIACCNGKIKISHNYIWRYSGEPFNKYPVEYETCCKKVVQYTKSGEYVTTYDSVKSAAQAVNKTSGAISMCCNGKTKTCAKYVWKFENISSRIA